MSSRSANPLRATEHLRLVPPAGGASATAQAAARVEAAIKAGAVAKAAAASAALKGRSLGDWMLNGIGIGAATASAGFATYALIFSTGEVVPSGNFNLFARYDRLYHGPTLRTGPAGTPPAGAPMTIDPGGEAPSAERTETASRDTVDFMPTGSVGPAPARDGGRLASSPADAASRPLAGFTLRDVFDGKALVESKSALSVVKLGSVIDGAGEVLSIEKQGDRWVVRTANGVIAGQRR